METGRGLSVNARFHRQGQDLLNSRPPQRPHREVPLLRNPATYLTTAACGFGSPCPRGAPACNFPARSPEGAGPTSSAPTREGWSADEPISWAGFRTRGPAPAQREPLSALALWRRHLSWRDGYRYRERSGGLRLPEASAGAPETRTGCRPAGCLRTRPRRGRPPPQGLPVPSWDPRTQSEACSRWIRASGC